VYHTKSKIDLVLRLITESYSHREIAEKTGVTKTTVTKWAAGHLPNYYTSGERSHDTNGEKVYATSTKICRKHRCRIPCVACDAWRHREKYPERFNGEGDPPPSLYDERHRKAVVYQDDLVTEAERRIQGADYFD
jgi:hypothetical protein